MKSKESAVSGFTARDIKGGRTTYNAGLARRQAVARADVAMSYRAQME